MNKTHVSVDLVALERVEAHFHALHPSLPAVAIDVATADDRRVIALVIAPQHGLPAAHLLAQTHARLLIESGEPDLLRGTELGDLNDDLGAERVEGDREL